MVERTAERQPLLPLKEALHPRNTPEMGFQSYEFFGGEKEARAKQKKAFMNGEIRNPTFDYPSLTHPLTEATLRASIRRLESSLARADEAVEPSAVWSSTAYRMAEIHYVLEAIRLNRATPATEAFHTSAQRFQEMGDQLYGKPDPVLTNQLYGEIYAQSHEKELHPDVLKIRQELFHGTSVAVAGEIVEVPSLPYTEKRDERLPKFETHVLQPFQEVLKEDFKDILDCIQDYWDFTVKPRAQRTNTNAAFTPQDMFELFQEVRNYQDPDGIANIDVIFDQKSAQLAWDTATFSYKIGAQRRPITTVGEMQEKAIHEMLHGLKAVNGLKSDLPVLGTGLFTEATEGERPDYLTFEEGSLSLSEIALHGRGTEKWEPRPQLFRYLVDALAYDTSEGRRDFRQIYESTWRAHAVMAAKAGEQLPISELTQIKSDAYDSVGRIFRGTPTQLHSEERPLLAFNKDNGYLPGSIMAYEYLANIGDDKEKIRQTYNAKADPTNSTHARITDRFAIPVDVT